MATRWLKNWAPLLLAFCRVMLMTTSIYVTAGCILFPTWWKSFVLGGFAKGEMWKDALGFLVLEFKSAKPLAAVLILGILAFVGFLVYWLGRHASEPARAKAAFFQKLPPSYTLATVSSAVAVVAFLFTLFQPGSYADSKALEVTLTQLTSSLRDMKALFSRTIEPPENGVYLYLNEPQVTKHFQALQHDMEQKGVSETTTTQTTASASASIAALNLGASQASTVESRATYGNPADSPPFFAGKLIRRLASSTNTLLWRPYDNFNARSGDFIIQQTSHTGVDLTQQQIDGLRAFDRAEFKKNTTQFTPFKILIYEGSIILRRKVDDIRAQFSVDGPLNLRAEGRLDKAGIPDAFLVSLDNRDNSLELPSVHVLAVITGRVTDRDGNIELAVSIECIW